MHKDPPTADLLYRRSPFGIFSFLGHFLPFGAKNSRPFVINQTNIAIHFQNQLTGIVIYDIF